MAVPSYERVALAGEGIDPSNRSRIGKAQALSLITSCVITLFFVAAFFVYQQQQQHGDVSIITNIPTGIPTTPTEAPKLLPTGTGSPVPATSPSPSPSKTTWPAASPNISSSSHSISNEEELLLTTCTWAPNQHNDCRAVLQERLCHPKQQRKVPRTLLLGDSTMHKLFNAMVSSLLHLPLNITLPEDISCRMVHNKQRCQVNDIFWLPFRTNRTWISPKPNVEGPLLYGLEHPYCQDCQGCETGMVECRASSSIPTQQQDNNTAITNHNMDLHYGGFLGVEFARDVEMQSDARPTTQENIAYYLEHIWNNQRMLQVWDRPTCVVNTQHHDAALMGLTQDGFVEHVRWYLRLLQPNCQHLVWLGTTAPLGKNKTDGTPWPQTLEKTVAWSHAVYQMLQTDDLLAPQTVFVDLYNASLSYQHQDNIHMDRSWYQNLAKLFEPNKLFLSCPL